jgi:hypothetical protein
MKLKKVKSKNTYKIKNFLVAVLKVTDENSRIRIRVTGCNCFFVTNTKVKALIRKKAICHVGNRFLLQSITGFRDFVGRGKKTGT